METTTTPAREAKPRLQFRIRTLLVMLTLGALLLGWWSDRRRLAQKLQQTQTELQSMRRVYEFTAALRHGDREEYIKKREAVLQSAAAEQAIPVLLRMIDAPDARVRQRAIAALGVSRRNDFDGPVDPVVPPIINALDDDDLRVESAAIHALWGLCPDQPRTRRKYLQKVAPKLEQRMNDDDCPNAAVAARVLKKLEPSRDVESRFIELLDNPMENNRWMAAAMLGQWGSQEAKAALSAQLEQESAPGVRSRLKRAIKKIESRSANGE